MKRKKKGLVDEPDAVEVFVVEPFLDGRDRYQAGAFYVLPPKKAGRFLAAGWVTLARDIDNAPRLDVAKRPWYRRLFSG